MVKLIICDTVMFGSYLAVLAFTVAELILLLKKLKVTAEGENSEKSRMYVRKFFLLLGLQLLAVIVSGVMCVSDGLSDTQNGLIVPVWVFASLALLLTIFLIVYTALLRKKYALKTSSKALGRYTGPVDLMIGILIAFLFAFHSSLVSYTILLLCA